LRSDNASTVQRFRGDGAVIANDGAAMARRFRIDFAAIPQRFRSDTEGLV
jgi:hypothetical protein